MTNALWIRVDANIGGKDVVWKLAGVLRDSAGIPSDDPRALRTMAVGILTMFWGAVAQHTDDGAVSEKADWQLEEWAGWFGPVGEFAKFVRAQCLTADGKIKRWDEMQGALQERRRRDRERKRAVKNSPKTPEHSAGIPQEVPRPFHGTPGVRNGTERNKKDQKRSARGKRETVPQESWVAEGTHFWREKVGKMTYPRFGSALSTLVAERGWMDVRLGLEEYIAEKNGKPLKLEWFAENAVTWIQEAKQPLVDPETRWLTPKGARIAGLES